MNCETTTEKNPCNDALHCIKCGEHVHYGTGVYLNKGKQAHIACVTIRANLATKGGETT